MIYDWWLVDDDILGKMREFIRRRNDELLHLIDTGMHKTVAVPSDFTRTENMSIGDALNLIADARARIDERTRSNKEWMKLVLEKLKDVDISIQDDCGDVYDLAVVGGIVAAWMEDLSIPSD